MPFYKWSGIDLSGQMQHGQQFAHSLRDLNHVLFNRKISLISADKLKIKWWSKKVTILQKSEFIAHLAVLLESEVRLYQALEIILNTINHKYFKIVLADISLLISQGTNLKTALSKYPEIFDSVTIALIAVGQETGRLASSLQKRAIALQEFENFRKKVKSALITPIITACAFLILMVAVFIFVIPQFESFFSTVQQPLPNSTLIIFKLSNWLRSYNFLIFAILIIKIIIFLRIFWQNPKLKKIRSYIKWKIPLFKDFLVKLYSTNFLQTLSILLDGGIHLPAALEIVKTTFKDFTVLNNIDLIQKEIVAGKSFNLAIKKSKLFSNLELEALITVGESSDLPKMVWKASQIYQSRVYAVLNRISVLVQPLILIILGLSIGALIFALYMPLLTLSYVVS